MKKGLFGKKGSAGTEEARQRLTLELSEIADLAEKLFRRMEERIEALKGLETRLDEKARALESLVARAGSIGEAQRETIEARRREILALARKGLKIDEIAGVFDMTKGEVELILKLEGK